MPKQDGFGRAWILENGIPIVESYGGGITLRALHYRLVAKGMPNTKRHYKRVIAAMTFARWEGLVEFGDFDDHERQVIGETEADPTDVDDEIANAISAIESEMRLYFKNRWENQPKYIEVWVEKKALQGTLGKPCRQMDVALCPCKGYPSLTYLAKASWRINEATERGQEAIILYFGDYDPSGEDIPRNIKKSLWRMGVDVKVKRIVLLEEQVIEWGLPPAPTKYTDTRSYRWDGIGQVELDAIEPRKLQQICKEAIEEQFSQSLHDELMKVEAEEQEKYKEEVFEKVKDLLDKMEG